jgi:DNA-binding Xre family transcriptional regulator
MVPEVNKRSPNLQKGYLRLGLIDSSGKRKFLLVHRLVAMAFIQTSDYLLQVNHINGVTEDNRVENLEWVTAHENQKHCYNVLYPNSHRGELHNRTDLTNSQVREIFKLTQNRDLTLKEISIKYRVSKATISQIKTGKAWSSVTGKKYIKTQKVILSNREIIEVYNLAIEGKIKHTDIAAKYDITKGEVSNIKCGIVGNRYTHHH